MYKTLLDCEIIIYHRWITIPIIAQGESEIKQKNSQLLQNKWTFIALCDIIEKRVSQNRGVSNANCGD